MSHLRVFVVIVATALTLSLGACANMSGGGDDAGSQAPKAEAKAKAPQSAAPPAGSKLSKVELGMSTEQVRSIMGAPTSDRSYVTGKAWIPFYYGGDTSRMDWKYEGTGRVVFGLNRYSGNAKVIRVDYDPSEAGQ